MTRGQITHDRPAADVELIYRWQVTPAGDEVRLTRVSWGWQDDTGAVYPSVEAAYADASERLDPAPVAVVWAVEVGA